MGRNLPKEPSRGAFPRSLLEEPSQGAFSRSLPKEPSRGAFPRSLSRRPVNIWPDDGVSKKKKFEYFFRFFGTIGHPIAAVKLSLSDVATNFRSAIDLWRSQGRFIGLNEENENYKILIFSL